MRFAEVEKKQTNIKKSLKMEDVLHMQIHSLAVYLFNLLRSPFQTALLL